MTGGFIVTFTITHVYIYIHICIYILHIYIYILHIYIYIYILHIYNIYIYIHIYIYTHAFTHFIISIYAYYTQWSRCFMRGLYQSWKQTASSNVAHVSPDMYHFLGDKHSSTTCFSVCQGTRVLSHSHMHYAVSIGNYRYVSILLRVYIYIYMYNVISYVSRLVTISCQKIWHMGITFNYVVITIMIDKQTNLVITWNVIYNCFRLAILKSLIISGKLT